MAIFNNSEIKIVPMNYKSHVKKVKCTIEVYIRKGDYE